MQVKTVSLHFLQHGATLSNTLRMYTMTRSLCALAYAEAIVQGYATAAFKHRYARRFPLQGTLAAEVCKNRRADDNL